MDTHECLLSRDFKEFVELLIKNKAEYLIVGCYVETGHRSATVCNLGNIAYELKRPLKWNPEK